MGKQHYENSSLRKWPELQLGRIGHISLPSQKTTTSTVLQFLRFLKIIPSLSYCIGLSLTFTWTCKMLFIFLIFLYATLSFEICVVAPLLPLPLLSHQFNVFSARYMFNFFFIKVSFVIQKLFMQVKRAISSRFIFFDLPSLFYFRLLLPTQFLSKTKSESVQRSRLSISVPSFQKLFEESTMANPCRSYSETFLQKIKRCLPIVIATTFHSQLYIVIQRTPVYNC